ncbi:MAG TPA: carboxypeptidase-like regulatory domain-containing protein, partial [Terriglobia bacterium]|nr:carboxypeptidase-like regulatory domain-containing protein [Terriglobia bacterium]
MKWTLSAVLLLLGIQGLPPLVAPLIPDSGGILTGTVRRADTNQPFHEAQITVVGEGRPLEQAVARGILTDYNGRFSVRTGEPGAYTVLVQAEGFFGATGEADGATRTTRDVYVPEGQQIDIGTLRLVPGATISGRITSPDGEPVAGAAVEALKASYIRGRLSLTLVKTAKTDDLGEYRMYWLPPGSYYVRGAFRSSAEARRERYDRLFFPGIPEEDAAPSIHVRSGSELSRINIRVPITPVEGVTLSGQVTGGTTGSDVRVTAVRAVPRDRRVLLIGDDKDHFENQAADTTEGRFEIRNVPAGDYNLLLLARIGARTQTVSIPVDVASRDIQNLTAALDPVFDVQGRLTLDGFASGDAISKNSLQLVRSDDLLVGEAFPITLNPDTGAFVISGLSPGKYALRLNSSFRAPDTYIADFKNGEASVFDSRLTIGGPVKEPLQLTLKSGGGIVTGTVFDSSRVRSFAYANV